MERCGCKLRLRRHFSGSSVPNEHGEPIKGDGGGGGVAGSSQVDLPCGLNITDMFKMIDLACDTEFCRAEEIQVSHL